MADKDKGTFFCELGRHVSRFCIGPRDMEPAFNEDIGKGTHAGAANADKMNVFDLIQIDHAVIPPTLTGHGKGFCGNTVRASFCPAFRAPRCIMFKRSGSFKAVPSRYTKSLP